MELTDKTTYIFKSFLLLLEISGKGQDVLGFTLILTPEIGGGGNATVSQVQMTIN